MTESSERGKYQRKYYEKNRKKIVRRRKRLYAEDEERRERILAASKAYKEANRPAQPKIKLPRHAKPMTKQTPSGDEIKLFSVGALSRAVKRSVQTISLWESKGIIPTTPYKDSLGHKYYTREMILVVREEVGDRSRALVSHGLMDKIRARWTDIGVPKKASSLEDAIKKTRFE